MIVMALSVHFTVPFLVGVAHEPELSREKGYSLS